MDAITTQPRQRKILTIKVKGDRLSTIAAQGEKIPRAEACYMVWREGGAMPSRPYDEPTLACRHAAALARKFPGERFHVLRSWRLCQSSDG